MIILKRFEVVKGGGLYGSVSVGGLFCCWSLELGWVGNKRGVSCVPTGLYSVVWYDSKLFGRCLLVKDVPGRTGILFHAGNSVKDTHGCILLGSKLDPENGRILESKKAVSLFNSLLINENNVILSIEEEVGIVHGGATDSVA